MTCEQMIRKILRIGVEVGLLEICAASTEDPMQLSKFELKELADIQEQLLNKFCSKHSLPSKYTTRE